MSMERRSLLIFVVCLAVLCMAGGLVVRAQTQGSGADVYNSGNLTCATGAVCVLTFDTDWADTDGYHSQAGNTNRLEIPWDGFYVVSAHVNFSGTTGGSYRRLVLRDDAGVILASQQLQPYAGGISMGVSSVLWLNLEDWVEVYFQHNAGVDLTVYAASRYSPCFRIVYVGFEYPTPQTIPTLDLTVLATLFPTDTAVPTHTTVPTHTAVPTHTPGWYLPTLTPIPTDTPGGAGADPDPYHTIITQTLTSGNQWAFDRSADAGEIIVGALLSMLLIVTGFAKMARWL